MSKSPVRDNQAIYKRQQSSIKKAIERYMNVIGKDKFKKKINIQSSHSRYQKSKTNAGYSIIKYKIDLEKNPRIYDKKFPELENLKLESKINLNRHK